MSVRAAGATDGAMGSIATGSSAKALRMLACASAVSLTTQGCDADVPAQVDGTAFRDSAGVLIAENVEPSGDETPAWRVGEDPILVVGEDRQASWDHLFTYIAGALRTSDGGVVVADRGATNVREYGPNGQYVSTWGRKGDGAGEFATVTGMHRWRPDSVVVWDMFARRLTVFDSDGRVGRVSRFSTLGSPSLVGVLPRERIVLGRVTTFEFGPEAGVDQFRSGYRREQQLYEIRDGTGEAPTLLGPYPHTEYQVNKTSTSLRIASIPYSRQVVAGIWNGLVVVGPNDTYELRAYNGDGSLGAVIRLAKSPVATTEAERRAYFNESRERDSQNTDLPIASHLPMFDRVIGDDAGYLWVRDYDLPGDGPVSWTVFDSLGSVVARSETPDNSEVWEIGADYVVASRVDGLGVQSVVVLPLQRRPRPPN